MPECTRNESLGFFHNLKCFFPNQNPAWYPDIYDFLFICKSIQSKKSRPLSYKGLIQQTKLIIQYFDYFACLVFESRLQIYL